MGCFPCFGLKDRKHFDSKIGKRDDKQREEQPTVAPPIRSDKPRSKIRVESERETPTEVPVQKDAPGFNISARKFTSQELETATRNFNPECFIGEGGFGKVYKGHLEGTHQVVAIKRFNRNGLQGSREFFTEVLMLCVLHHTNLVNLIGFCGDGDPCLVYEFMPLGSLEDHLHDLPPGKKPLDWNTRMKIAAGAARGIKYLHNEADPPVIYRDIKSSNILLDEGFHPKLSDFGLAKFGPIGDKSHVSTRVMGTYGYCAPEYAMTGQLTMRSDIYSFGVVLLELITGQKAIDETRPQREQNLVAWARPMLNDRKQHGKLVDPKLQGQYPARGLQRALLVTSMCIRQEAATRPTISDVVTALSYLNSQAYDPNSAPSGSNSSSDHNGRGSRGGEDERGGRIVANNEDGEGSSSKWDVERLHREGSPRKIVGNLNRDPDRERAVAEAKMWGENWREKRCASEQNNG